MKLRLFAAQLVRQSDHYLMIWDGQLGQTVAISQVELGLFLHFGEKERMFLLSCSPDPTTPGVYVSTKLCLFRASLEEISLSSVALGSSVLVA